VSNFRVRNVCEGKSGMIFHAHLIAVLMSDEGRDKFRTLDIASLSEGTSLQKHSGMTRVVEGFHPHTHVFIHEWYEPYLHLRSQPKLVPIYRPWRDGRLSWPGHHHGQ